MQFIFAAHRALPNSTTVSFTCVESCMYRYSRPAAGPAPRRSNFPEPMRVNHTRFAAPAARRLTPSALNTGSRLRRSLTDAFGARNLAPPNQNFLPLPLTTVTLTMRQGCWRWKPPLAVCMGSNLSIGANFSMLGKSSLPCTRSSSSHSESVVRATL
ncbi:hypothetical protein Bbelb_334380 [Branchiostoma belcheri]|nr:hypothetical protein Bbelb_334380 [Branchiostoma belcheri]